MRPAVVLDGRSLTPEGVGAVARDGRAVVLDPAARARNAAARRAVDELLARGAPIYGVTTGVGALRVDPVAPADRPEHQLRLLRSHAGGAGAAVAPARVRAAMVVRANQLGAGGAGVADDLLDAVTGALNAGFTPVVRELGSLGTGDLTALAEIALALLGEGRAWSDGDVVPAAAELGAAGLAVPVLGPRDGIAFMSSGAATIGRAALVALDAARLHGAALAVAALSFVAAGADPGALDARVHAARPHPGQVAVAARLRRLLEDVPARTTADVRAGCPVQDGYVFRALAQVEGTVADARDELGRVLAVELNAAGENALIDPDGPAALPGANFHLGALALALDRQRLALAHAGTLTAGRLSALIDRGLAGLPRALAERPGADSGALILEYTAHGAAADVRSSAAPVTTLSTTVGGGVESHASFADLAARRAEAALDAMAVVVGCELVAAVRALRLGGARPPGDELAGLYDSASAQLDPAAGDRPLGDDVEAARRLVADGAWAPYD